MSTKTITTAGSTVITTEATTTSAASTNLGPLTTTYTPAGASCADTFYATNPLVTTGWLVRGEPGDSMSECMPSSYTRVATYYYSPGVCPSGFTAACSSYDGTTTVATCCPSSYECYGNPGAGNLYGCTSTFGQRTTLTIESVDFETITSSGTTKYPVVYATTTMTVDSGVAVSQYAVIVQRVASDPAFQATESTTADATTGSDSSASATSSTATSTSTSGSSSTGLSTGAQAGIGVGVALGVIAIIAALFFVFRARKKKKQEGPQEVPDNAYYESTPGYQQQDPALSPNPEVQYSPHSPVKDYYSYELSPNLANQPVELPDSSREWVEMPGSTITTEMPGSSPRQ